RSLISSMFLFGVLVIGPAAFAQSPPLANSALQQMQAIANDKSSWNEAQQKLEPKLLYAARAAKGLPQVPGAQQLPQLYSNDLVNAAGQVRVDISTTDATGLTGVIQSLGGTVISSFPQYEAVRASLPVTALENLAANASVKSVRTADDGVGNK